MLTRRPFRPNAPVLSGLWVLNGSLGPSAQPQAHGAWLGAWGGLCFLSW